jgi:hypothetical protein
VIAIAAGTYEEGLEIPGNGAATSVTLIGAGGEGSGTTTINGNPDGRVVMLSPGANVAISGVTITGGNVPIDNPGAGIFNRGTLRLNHSTVSANTGGNGAGIFNEGTLTLSTSTVSANTSAGDGGGILNEGMLTLTNSHLSSNTATSGGAIYNSKGSVALRNSVMALNTASEQGGGVYDEGGSVALTSSALRFDKAEGGSGSGGGIYNVEGFGEPFTFARSAVLFNGPENRHSTMTCPV